MVDEVLITGTAGVSSRRAARRAHNSRRRREVRPEGLSHLPSSELSAEQRLQQGVALDPPSCAVETVASGRADKGAASDSASCTASTVCMASLSSTYSSSYCWHGWRLIGQRVRIQRRGTRNRPPDTATATSPHSQPQCGQCADRRSSPVSHPDKHIRLTLSG